MNYTGVVTEELMHWMEPVYRLRYEVLVNEQGKRPKFADHSSCMVREPLDENGITLVKIVNDRLLGAARINRFSDMQDPFFLTAYCADFFHDHALLDEIIIISRMVLVPDSRGSASFVEFVRELYRWLFCSGRSLVIIECTTAYERIFKRLGFVQYNGCFKHPDGMMVSPMLFDCNNRSWLRQIGSILDIECPPHFVCKPHVSNVLSAITGATVS